MNNRPPQMHRYRSEIAADNNTSPRQRTQTVDSIPQLIAYLYTVFRHDDAMVRRLDYALKHRYCATKDPAHVA